MENTGRKNNDIDGNVGMGQPDDNGFVRPFVQPRGRRPLPLSFCWWHWEQLWLRLCISPCIRRDIST